MTIATDCPHEELLRGYLSGRVAVDASSTIEEHLSGCSRCLDQLETWSSGQSLLGDIRRIAPVAASSPALARAVANVLGESSPTPRFLVAGSELREYRLLEQIGQGGMGTVFRALHTRLDKVVAVKVIRAARQADAMAVARFEREMQAVGRVEHPNIVRATDAGEVDGIHFLVMEFVDGVTLAQLVREHGPLPKKQACEYVIQAAAGLALAHRNGVIHRDVKPSNLILTPDGTVKILDLGLALLPGPLPDALPENDATIGSTDWGETCQTETGVVMGTRDYMAPEQASNPHLADVRADVYSLGATLWHLLTGTNYVSQRLDNNQRLPGGVPERIWQKLLAENPRDRFDNVQLVAQELRRFTNPPTRNRRLQLAGLALFVAMFGVVAWSASKSAPPSIEGNEHSQVKPQLRPEPRRGKLPMSPAETQALQKEWADYRGVSVAWGTTHEKALVLIPPGEFEHSPLSTMIISKPVYMSKCEVTMRDFCAFVDATGYVTEAKQNGFGGQIIDAAQHGPASKSNAMLLWDSPGYAIVTDAHPVTQITWNDAVAYCKWRSEGSVFRHRLPTEAEWVWAAMAGVNEMKYPESGDDSAAAYGWYRANTKAPAQPQPVGKLRPNAFGLHDMFGNVSEMCHDYFGEYPKGRSTDYQGPDSHPRGWRVLQGTNYVDVRPNRIDRWRSNACAAHVGFRIVREIE